MTEGHDLVFAARRNVVRFFFFRQLVFIQFSGVFELFDFLLRGKKLLPRLAELLLQEVNGGLHALDVFVKLEEELVQLCEPNKQQ